jgi:hypothetical protein
MTAIKNISIPQPCHQSWQQMTAVDKGRHCASCCKTVVDFTRMSNSEIIKYLSLKTNVCGRIEQYQLVHINNTLSAQGLKAGWWKRVVVILGLISPVFFKANAQSRPAIVNTLHKNKRALAKNAPFLKVRSLHYIPQQVSIDEGGIRSYQISPEIITTVTLGGIVAVPIESNTFEFKKAFRRFRGRFGEVRRELAIDSNNMCMPYF